MGWSETYFERELCSKDKRKYCKKYIDDLYTWEDGATKVSVVKSTFVSNVYYAAVNVIEKDTGTEYVCGKVVLTGTREKKWFQYKCIDENMGPCESKCPVSILKMLSPTDHEWALEWRRRCYENAEKEKLERNNPNKLSRLPVGTTIKFKITVALKRPCLPEGTEVCLTKCNIRGKDIWIGYGYRWKRTAIPNDYVIVSICG